MPSSPIGEPSQTTHGTSHASSMPIDGSLPTFTQHNRLMNPSSSFSEQPASLLSTSFTRHRPGRSFESNLNEFQSLLEAAQRLPTQSPAEHPDNSEDNNRLTAPLIRRSQANSVSRRRSLVRQYSGRPHVPGEDSGSETEEIATSRRQSQAPGSRNGSISMSRPTAFMSNSTEEHDTESEMSRYRGSHERQRHNVSSLERQQGVSDILQDTRRMLEARQTERTRDSHHSNAAAQERHRRLESLLARQSLYDWGPNPLTPTSDHLNSNERTYTSSNRRWRPPERLQDYASSHNRQISATATLLDNDAQESIFSSFTARSEHNDIASRVDRALREYSDARRALRARNETGTSTGSSVTETLTTRGLRARVETEDERRDSRERTSWNVPPRYNDRFDLNPPAARHGVEDRHHDLLRRRFRDLGWIRRRDLINEALDSNEGLVSGPLFDNASSAETRRELDRWRTRNMLNKSRCAEARSTTPEMIKARSTLRYLTRLREPDMNRVKAWKLASELGLHNQSLEEDGSKSLPLSIGDLPGPAYCSWLEPGIVWTGRQSAEDKERRRFSIPSPIASTSITTQAATAQDTNTTMTDTNESTSRMLNRASPHDPLEEALMSTREQAMVANDVIALAQNSMQVLENAERELSTMLEQSERLLEENRHQLQENTQSLARDTERLRVYDDSMARSTAGHGSFSSNPIVVAQPRDQWSVKVTLHEVDWHAMTVTGTMTASSGLSQEVKGESSAQSNTSMDSFFTGEIIDFAQHGLDTVGHDMPSASSNIGDHQQQQTWKIGGPGTDLIYWAGIGPFQEAVQERLLSRSREVLGKASHADSDMSNSTFDGSVAPVSENPALFLTAEERSKIKLQTMHELLSDSTWLKENLNEKGWILMRWKERCFVAPGLTPNPEPTRPWIPHAADDTRTGSGTTWSSFTGLRLSQDDARSRIYTTNAEERGEITGNSGQGSSTWGLTISGFYYVALHRMSGRIEGLYYDAGSAPYQHLRMSPGHGSAINPEIHERDHATKYGSVRSSFNLVKFR